MLRPENPFVNGQRSLIALVGFGVAPFANSVGVQANFAGLVPGVRNGTLRLAFADGSVRTVGVTSVLPSTGATGTSKNLPRAAANCSPKALVPAFLSLAPGFTVTGSNPNACPQPLSRQGRRRGRHFHGPAP